ncbi:hypothetical protein QBC47DRAFT_68044 [Echria macrotheca]|uniref:F-box domain-containing protein n=1 Tax=Echria macrotheca TaxID=438768 RepID=A0AAJ0B5Q9_9PEZI|nr:hypothetical protein QBC47DRAFT_68044 [Echria macrotheca]
MASSNTINTVPNEILLSVLTHLPSDELLRLTTVSRRFCSAVLRLFRQRLADTAALPDHRLILECYQPSAKLSTPYLYCDYLSTDGLSDPESELTPSSLASSYSHFRPVKQDENRRGRRRYFTASSAAVPGASPDLPDVPSQDIFLDEDVLFSQLCTVTNLVKMGPKPGLFLSHVNVGDGLIRVWRNWLAANAGSAPAPILWADTAHTVGVRFRVAEREQPGAVLVAVGDEMPLAYRLEFDEVVVRAGWLLLMVERSERQEVTTSGKAIVIASI